MYLKILFNDFKRAVYPCTRVFLIDTKFLYYETINHERGHGIKIPYDTVRDWEVSNFLTASDLCVI